WLKTLYRKRAVTWPFIFYTIIWTLSIFSAGILNSKLSVSQFQLAFFFLFGDKEFFNISSL
ncbi:hypothetical protein, partial [Enterococcus faecium]|uniref:hypothetical protein n=1 Tax=Enterococcus faecium TaxID=1352 RepID=UPI003D1C5B01